MHLRGPILKIYLILTIDYTTANGPDVVPPLTETQKAALYAELASGAETGWDYTMRWFRAGNLSAGLLALNVRNTIAVDLNSLLCTCTPRCRCKFC
jgi:alpha,alpha-trehalase